MLMCYEMDATPRSLSHPHPDHVNYHSRLTTAESCLSTSVAVAWFQPQLLQAQQTGVSARLGRRWQVIVLTQLQKIYIGTDSYKGDSFTRLRKVSLGHFQIEIILGFDTLKCLERNDSHMHLRSLHMLIVQIS